MQSGQIWVGSEGDLLENGARNRDGREKSAKIHRHCPSTVDDGKIVALINIEGLGVRRSSAFGQKQAYIENGRGRGAGHATGKIRTLEVKTC